MSTTATDQTPAERRASLDRVLRVAAAGERRRLRASRPAGQLEPIVFHDLAVEPGPYRARVAACRAASDLTADCSWEVRWRDAAGTAHRAPSLPVALAMELTAEFWASGRTGVALVQHGRTAAA